MSINSVARFLSHSIKPKTSKIATSNFSTTSSPDKIHAQLQNNPTNLEKILNLIEPKLDSKCVNAVLTKCTFSNTQMGGLRFFIWAGSCTSDYKHSSFSYGKVCKLFNIKQNPHVFLDLLEVYKVDKCAVSVKMFKVVLNLCKECNLAYEALLVLRKMEDFGVCADCNAYSIVIRLFCDEGDVDVARKLMEEMGRVGIHADMVIYVSMIKGFCDAGRLEDACGLFKEMKADGCVPNVVAYSTLLDGICRFGSVKRALELLYEMEKEGGDCSPNVLTYTSVIQRLCEKGRTMDAFTILDRMEACGCFPNRVTVNALLKGLCMDGNLEEAYKLVDRVAVSGVVSYGDCYSSLIVSLIRIKNLEEAEKLFRRTICSGVKPDGLACTLMIKGLCLENRMLDGYCLYDEIEKIGFLSTVDSDIYSILLVGLCQQGHSAEAAELARSMLQKSICLKRPYVDKVVEHLKKFGLSELVKD